MFEDHWCTSAEATFELGRKLAESLQPGDVIGLVGDLGAGKTMLTQGVAAGLRVPEAVRITSPTFSLINEYRGGRLAMVHVDLYRIEDDSELEHIGLDEMLENEGVSLVEWCSKFPVLPDDHLLVEISICDGDQRLLSARGTGPRGIELASAWAESLAATN